MYNACSSFMETALRREVTLKHRGLNRFHRGHAAYIPYIPYRPRDLYETNSSPCALKYQFSSFPNDDHFIKYMSELTYLNMHNLHLNLNFLK